MYDRGLGVAQDSKIAAHWYRKAAEGGDPTGKNNLADMYLRGEGVSQDDATAFRLFQQAASQGQTGARIKLGYMYAEGRGTHTDLETAYTWLTAATIAGDSRGLDLLRSLESQLSPDQIARAKDGARNLQSGHQKQLFSARSLALP